MKRLVAESKRLMPDVGVQVPPNLSDWWVDLVEAGATDLGGLSANGDHISPEHPFPSPHEVRKRLRPRGYALTERLCVYPQYMNEEWMDPRVLEVLERAPTRPSCPRPPAQRLRANGRALRATAISPPARSPRAARAPSSRPTSWRRCSPRPGPEAIEEMRQAADELRAELAGDVATFVVNRNINFTNVCTVGCAFCGFGQTQRSPDAYELDRDEFADRVREAIEFGATEICMQGGIHPDYTLEHYGEWLRLAKEVAPDVHLHAYSPMEVHFMCERSGRDPDYVFAYLRELRARLDPGHGRRGARGRRAAADLAEQAAGGALGRDHRGLTPRRAALDLDGDVRPHRAPGRARRAHARRPRAAGAHRGDHRVRPALASSRTTRCWAGPTGSRRSPTRRTSSTRPSFRLALGRSIPNLQASWVKMGLDAASEALRWGVNDLGGTLMEESISRMAGSQHGSRLEPEDLIDAARRAGRTPAQRNTLYEVLETY